MSGYVLLLAGFGTVVLLTAWLPMVLRALPLSLPICCVAIGVALGLAPEWLVPTKPLVEVAPHLTLIQHATEIVVIISLMGAGLKIDRVLGLATWSATWRLLGVAMPLTILALTALGGPLLGVGLASALLLAAALAPTDPVLASDVQVGPPGEGCEDEMRFALTSEAGLNDGLAFPFVMLAIAAAGAGSLWDVPLGHWLAVDVAWKIACGVGLGAAVGYGLGWLTFHLPNRGRLSRTGDGFVALGITCLAYGVVEIAHGYGFIAVFVAALALRATERGHEYHHKLLQFAEELERLLMMVLLVGFGAAIGSGLFAALTPAGVLYAALALLVVRPVCAWVSLLGTGTPAAERAVIAFFGIRGIGTVYYLAYALGRARFEGADLLLATAGLAVAASILLHGVTVTPVLRYLDRRSGRDTESAQLDLALPAPPNT
jgi:sodium/hydrogen antiporter